MVDRVDGQLAKPRVHFTEEPRLLCAAASGDNERRTQALKLRRCRVESVAFPLGVLRIPSCNADETLPSPRRRKPSMDVVPHLNIRLTRAATMST